MIGRLMSLLTTVIVCFCVATTITAAAGVGYLWSQQRLTQENTYQIIALLQGIDLADVYLEANKDDSAGQEMPSFDEYLERRSRMSVNLQMRENEVTNHVEQLKVLERDLKETKTLIDRIRNRFDEELLAQADSARVRGQADVRATLEKIAPEQAKQQLLLMVDQGEINEVVAMMAGMSVDKRKKIVSAFSDEEAEQLYEIFEKRRQGVPEIEIIENARANLQGIGALQQQQQPPQQ
jgi:hypothetical protein